LGRPKTWRDWTKKWGVAKRPIKVFHAVDAQNLAGEFKGWDATDRDEVVKRILPVIAQANFPGIVIGINLDAFREAFGSRPDLLAIFGTPYTACFHWVVQSILYLQARVGSHERIGFIHEFNDFRGEALEAFGYIQKHGNQQGSVIGLQFGTKESYPPLQAADILAYEGNKRLRDPDRPERLPWQVINPDRRILAAHYGRENMPELVSRMEKIKDGKIGEIEMDTGWAKFLRSASMASS
jgi:hypothetical protein